MTGLKNPAQWIVDFLGGSTSSDVKVTEKTALALSAVFVSVNILSEAFASLPISVYQKKGAGKFVANDNPVHHLIHNSPNEAQTAFNFWQTVIIHMTAWGNAYARIIKDARMSIQALVLLKPWEVSTYQIEGKVYYRCKGEIIEANELLHFRAFSLDGITGISRIRYNAETIGLGLKQQIYSGTVYGKPPGYLSTDQTIKEAQLSSIRNSWEAQTKGKFLGRIPVLHTGLKYNQLMVNPADLQYIQASNLTETKVYGIFRIPPTLAQNYERATFSNAEQQDLVFLKHTLTPYIVNIEQELNKKVFPESNKTSATPYYTKVNSNAILRGDYRTRTEGYRTLWNIGALSQNDIRELEDQNPIDGGGRYYVPMNMVPTDQVDTVILKNKGKEKNENGLSGQD